MRNVWLINVNLSNACNLFVFWFIVSVINIIDGIQCESCLDNISMALVSHLMDFAIHTETNSIYFIAHIHNLQLVAYMHRFLNQTNTNNTILIRL